ncbi:glucosamine-6-phosphate deaminase [Aliifodinibius sp. S!AR15-10]|uniref:glucosamine-6-phosphate deaminase n=1 Tax=Aliifodinibius sp. S!AR15-10 TaxID=2950437 RepID=UPI0028623998|nr:glucosamine-6-phosphate deaminase [Aliifodinibius sp. S!AR15-10]MDR8390064.1 glucosamine-6-phosphate deaminase [Aliifodinibius sp. S!AR15-10]
MMENSLTLQSKVDSLAIKVYRDDTSMGRAAASFVADQIAKVLERKEFLNLMLATGASQFSFLEAFKKNKDIEWSRIRTFHLDEYIGLSLTHKASFRKYLQDRIIDDVQPKEAFFLQGDTEDIQQEIERYENLLEKYPIDVACIGIGENGHIAFNDPPIADFEDPKMVKVVELDEQSRRQQVGEGWFNGIDDVPTQALSLTIPAIMASGVISCVVPDRRKAQAVHNALYGPISTDCPASILRTHDNAVLFLDEASAEGLKGS